MYSKRISIGEGFGRIRKHVNPGLPQEVTYLEFPRLSKHRRLAHGVFSRHGGVSKAPYDSLNTSFNTGDNPDSVAVNLEIIKGAIGAEHLIFMNQVHGKEVRVLHQGHAQEFAEPANVDAMVTDIPGLALMVKQADCQGVILFDPINGVVSNIHCGWKGNTYNILGSVVRHMKSGFRCRVSDILAAIGPSLGPCCAEFTTHEQIFPEPFRQFMVREDYFDLWEISRWQLMEAGIREENIEVARICTGCRTDKYYSYRVERVTGRFATVAMLK